MAKSYRMPMASKLIAMGVVVSLLHLGMNSPPRSLALLVLVLAAMPTGFIWAAALLAVVCAAGKALGDLPISVLPPEALLLSGLTTLALCYAWFGRLVTQDSEPQMSRTEAWLRQLLQWALLTMGVTALISVLFRSTSVTISLMWAVLLLLAYWQTGSATGRRDGPSRRLPLAEIGFGVVLIVATPLLAEGLARLVLPQDAPPGDVFVAHPKYFYLNKPGAVANVAVDVSPNERVYFTHTMSSLGLRDKEYGAKAPGEFRILMLGDSFTVGHTAKLEDTIPKLLERRLQEVPSNCTFTVINGGCGASGPLQALGMLRERGLTLKPDLVIHQLFPQNDIENSLIGTGVYLRACNQRFYQRLYNIQNQDTFPVWSDQWLRNHSRFYRELWRVTGYRNLFTEFLHDFRLYPAFEGFVPPPTENRPFDLEVNLREWYPELEEGFRLLRQYELEIRDECHNSGIDFMAYCIPDFRDLENALREPEYQWIEASGLYEPGKAVRLTERFLEESRIPFVRITDTLAAWPDIDEIYFRHDYHLTRQGNEIVAGMLHNALTESYLREMRLIQVSDNEGSCPGDDAADIGH